VCCGFVGGGRKSRLICYVSRLGRRKISEPATARHVCFIAVTEEVVRGRGWQNVLIQAQEWEMTEKLDGQEEKGFVRCIWRLSRCGSKCDPS
jgi:hypothetical protein